MVKKYLGIVAGLLMLAGCSNNDFTDNGIAPEGQKRTISTVSATIEGADTRVDLVDGKKLVWLASDHISVFSDDEDNGWITRFDITDGIGTSTATFKGESEVSGSEFYAFYPGTEFKLNQSAQTVYFYWIYDVIFSSDFSPMQRSIPMFAKGTGSNFVFQKLAGLLHFQVKGKGSLIEAKLIDNAGEKFGDYFTLEYGGTNLVLNPMDDSAREDYITGAPNLDTPLSDTEPVDIYFSLPANKTFEQGFSLELKYYDENKEEKTYTHKTEKGFAVKAGEVSTFPALVLSSSGGGVEPTYGWESNFCTLSGKEVSVSYYFNYDKTKIFWDFTFLTEDKADPIILEFWKDYNGGTPDLSWIDPTKYDDSILETSDFRFHDYENNLIYRPSDASIFTIMKNSDGTWSLRLEGVKLYENNGNGPDLSDIYVNFDGYFNYTPPPTWNFTGAAWMSGAYATIERDIEEAGDFSQYGAEHGRDFVRWRLRFTNFPWGSGSSIPSDFKEVVIIWEEEHEGVLPAFPTDATINEFWLDIMSQGYDIGGQYVMNDDNAQLSIHQNDDGAYEISVSKGIKMYPLDSDVVADPKASNFSFNGVLTEKYKEDEAPQGGIYINDGENSAMLIINTAYYFYSEDGIHIVFKDIQVSNKEINSIDNSYLLEDIKDAEIVLVEYGGDVFPPVGTYKSYLQLTDGAGNLLWKTDKDQDMEITSEGIEFYPSIKTPNGRSGKLDFVWNGAIDLQE